MEPNESVWRRARRALRGRWWLVYLGLLAASHAVQLFIPEHWYRLAGPSAKTADIQLGDQRVRLAYLEWGGAGPEYAAPPIILLHGCPGQGADFSRLGPLLSARGRRTIAVDQLGFGGSSHWVRDYSIAANAPAVLSLMDELGIGRAHILGWSNGGGTALHMADEAPGRIASVTMLASIGAQEVEGSGSWFFEHVKYGAGMVALVAGGELMPHFGLLGPLHFRHASMRFFWDTDQRPLTGIMERLAVPTLILHGRGDPLVHARAAELHHRLVAPSRLVMLNASHFLPFLQPGQTAAVVGEFIARHDAPGATALRQSADLSPAPDLGGAAAWFTDTVRGAPWWAVLAALGGLVAWRRRTGAAIAGLLVGGGLVDFGVGIAAILGGQMIAAAGAYRRGRLRRGNVPRVHGSGESAHALGVWLGAIRARPVRTALGSRFLSGEHRLVWEAAGLGGPRAGVGRLLAASALAWLLWALFWTVVPAIVYAALVAPMVRALGVWGAVLGVAGAMVVVGSAELLLTRRGRRRARVAAGRLVRREYWPAWSMYVPLVPGFAVLGLRHRGPLVFTCCNPGIGAAGGVVGESKKAILDALEDEAVLASEFIGPAGTATERAARAIDAVRRRPELGGLPVILKPDEGQRGHAVRLARSEADIEEYFRTMTAPAIVQRYHPGPHECGVLWARRSDGAANGRAGFIFSVTRKEFPVLVGDGARTLEALIHGHPRFRLQAHVFLERFALDRSRVPGAGEKVRLAVSGNHCQGTLFCDGADLITPALEARIDEIARSFAGAGLDIGRFDIRYESEEGLRRAEGLAVVELNGVTGESTNIYDPRRPLWWAYAVLWRQWRLMYRLGAERRDQGVRPTGAGKLVRMTRAHARARRGSAVSD